MKNLFDDREKKRKWFGRFYNKNRARLLVEYANYRNSHKDLLKAKQALKDSGVRKSNILGSEVMEVLRLECRDCGCEFLSRKTRSHNPPEFCAFCRAVRAWASKRVHDKARYADPVKRAKIKEQVRARKNRQNPPKKVVDTV